MNNRIIAIVGETASGKSGLAHRVAENLDGEIIAADSWTVRSEFDIGTAKPTKKEQEEVNYHLLDVVNAENEFTAARFQKLADQKIRDILLKGKTPIIVGGTGLYVDSVLYSFSFLPQGDKSQREKLNSLSIQELIDLAREKSIDLDSVDIRNKRRIIRAIESNGRSPTRNELLEGALIVGLKLSRSELRERIERRVDTMMAKGLKYEVEKLSKKYSWNTEAMKGIGYREWQQYFNGEVSKMEVRRKIIKSTLDLAKRQRSWFKRNSDIVWFDDPEKAYKYIEEKLKTKH